MVPLNAPPAGPADYYQQVPSSAAMPYAEEELPAPNGSRTTYYDPIGDELWSAVGAKDIEEVDRLLRRGANPNMVCPDGWVRDENRPKDGGTGRSLLHHAAWAGDLAVFKLIVAAGGDIDRKRNTAWRPNGGVRGRGASPLHHAVMYNRDKIVLYLLDELGCDVNTPGEQGYTPLHLACKFNYPKMCELLLMRGARTDMLTRDERTARELAQAQQERSHAQMGNMLALFDRPRKKIDAETSKQPERGEGDFEGVALTGAYVALEPRPGTAEVMWTEVVRPPSSSQLPSYERTCRWLEAAKAGLTVATHGLYVLGTPECPGHLVMRNTRMGSVFQNVGPVSSSDPTNARSRAFIRQQLRDAGAVLEPAGGEAQGSEAPGTPEPSTEALVEAETRLIAALELAQTIPAPEREVDVVVQMALLLAQTTGRRCSTAAAAAAVLEKLVAAGGWGESGASEIKKALREVKRSLRAPPAELRRCKCCAESKPREAFSANQWKQGKRRCNACQQGGVTVTAEQREEADRAAEEAALDAAFAAEHARKAAEERARVEAILAARNAEALISEAECPICFEERTADERCLMHAPVQHWVCRVCLADMIARAGPASSFGEQVEEATGVSCPICRKLCSRDILAELLRPKRRRRE